MHLDDDLKRLLEEDEPKQPNIDIRPYVKALAHAKRLVDEAVPAGGAMEKATLITLVLPQLIGFYIRPALPTPAVPAIPGGSYVHLARRCPYLSELTIAAGRVQGVCTALRRHCSALSVALSVDDSPYTHCLTYVAKQEMESENAAS